MAHSISRPTWAIVATMKEDKKSVQDFVAHYIAMGADEIHIYLDDPNDTSFLFLDALPKVFPVLCDDMHWAGSRPKRHERRQTLNARDAYQKTECDWIIHADADEFIYCPEGVANLLATLAPTQPAARVIPAEPLIRPGTTEIKAYRSPLPGTAAGRRIGHAAFGDVYALLAGGLLSHMIGKYFVRSGLEGAPITIHRPRLPREADIPDLPKESILLLHHHGNDEEEWIRKFRLRFETTYSAQFWDDKPNSGKLNGVGLNGYLKAQYEVNGEAGLRKFFGEVYHIDHRKAVLRRANAIHRPYIWLDQKREDLFENSAQICKNFQTNPDNGKLEAEAHFLGVKMTITPDASYFERVLAQGGIVEEAEMRRLQTIVDGEKVQFWDVGAQTGVYSFVVAAAAAKAGSKIYAFDTDKPRVLAIERNAALGKYKNVHVETVDTETGSSWLSNSVSKGDAGLLSILRIDMGAAVPDVFAGFFQAVDAAHYPDYLLYKHAHSDLWDVPVDELFPPDLYEVDEIFGENTLLKAKRV